MKSCSTVVLYLVESGVSEVRIRLYLNSWSTDVLYLDESGVSEARIRLYMNSWRTVAWFLPRWERILITLISLGAYGKKSILYIYINKINK